MVDFKYKKTHIYFILFIKFEIRSKASERALIPVA